MPWSLVMVPVGVQFWKTKDIDLGDGSVGFVYVLDEEAPVMLSETNYLTLSDTPQVAL